MEDVMAKVTILMRIKDGEKYPYVKPVWAGNRLKQGWALVAGVPTERKDGTYYLRYTENGKRRMEPCESQNVTDVLSFKASRESKLKAQADGLVVVEPGKPEPVGVNAVELVTEYLAETQANKRAATYEAYRLSMESFKKWFKGDLSMISRGDLLNYKNHLKTVMTAKGTPLSGRSVYNRFNDLMAFLKWARITTDLRKGDWPPKPERTPEEYTDEQIQALLTSATDEGRLVMKCFLCSGLRSGELSHLTYRDVDFVHSVFTVQPKVDWDGKTKAAQREVPVDAELTKKLTERMQAKQRTINDLIFPNNNDEADTGLLRHAKRAAKKAGLVGIRVDDHKFRSTAITRWLRAGNSIPDVMEWVGHVDMETIRRYAAKDKVRRPEVRAKAVAAFSAFQAMGD
jgi:integrase